MRRVQNEKLDFDDYPGEGLIRKLAKVVGADADELLILAEKVPDQTWKRVIQQPDAFRKFTSLDDKTIDKLLEDLGDE